MAWRRPSAAEASLLRALAGGVPGGEALLAQLASLDVQDLDEEGSLELRTRGPPALDEAGHTLEGVPVDAVGHDVDGVELNAFLHVLEGRMTELELVKADGTPLRRLPEGKAWKVVGIT